MLEQTSSDELAALACAIESRGAAETVALGLDREDFGDELSRDIFDSICSALGESDATFDRALVMSAAEDHGISVDVFIDFTTLAKETYASVENVDHFVSKVSERSSDRRLVAVAREIASKKISAKGAREALQLELQKMDQRKTCKLESVKSIVDGVLLETEKDADDSDCLKTGFKFWDGEAGGGGLRKSAFVVIGAATGVGKTSFAIQMALHVSTQKRVLIFSYEMSKSDNVKRMLAQVSGVAEGKIRAGMDKGDRALVSIAGGSVGSRQIDVAADPSLSVDEVCGICRRESLRGDVGLVVVDYLQLIDGAQGETREREVASVSRKLRKMSLGAGVPVVALAQLNRSLNNRDDKRPRVSDLRESGSIEQDATMVLLLHRPGIFDDRTPPEEAEVFIGKNRHGRAHLAVRAKFRPERTLFEC